MPMPAPVTITPEDFLKKVEETDDAEQWHLRISRHDVCPVILYLVDGEGEIKAFSPDLLNCSTQVMQDFQTELGKFLAMKTHRTKGTIEVY